MDNQASTPKQPQPQAQDPKPQVVIAGKEIIKRLDLPTPGAYVVLLTNPKASVFQQMQENDNMSVKNIITYLIREWNFADEQSNVLPISQENADLSLSVLDINAINRFIGLDKLMSDKKKSS